MFESESGPLQSHPIGSQSFHHEFAEPPIDTSAQYRGMGIAGLFAGIGGLELGLAAHGHETRLLCEIDPHALRVLERRFEQTAFHIDVRTLGPSTKLLRDVDLVSAGFPCQDLSQAGRIDGIDGKNSGLVREIFRIVEQFEVGTVLLENVRNMLHLARGRALELIVSEFESMGYHWAYRTVDTRAFGLPQRRERVFFLASKALDPRNVLLVDDAGPPARPKHRKRPACGFYWTEGNRGLGWGVDVVPPLKLGSGFGIPSAPAVWSPCDQFFTPDIRDAERLQGFESNWTALKPHARSEHHRWRLVGNAVTVDVARWLGRRLVEPRPYEGEFDERLARYERWPRAAWGSPGKGRFRVERSHWPIRTPTPSLSDFLEHEGNPLSVRAASGFRNRFEASSLRKSGDFKDNLIQSLDAYIHAG